MRLLAAIVIIAVIAVIGSRITFLNRRLPMGFRSILFTGTEYIFLGVILGEMGLQVLNADTLKQLEPAVLFALAWIGFLFGVQFEIKFLKNLPRFYFSITAIQAIIAFVMVALFFVSILKLCGETDLVLIFLVALVLGSTACCSAQSALAVIAQTYKFANRGAMELLRYMCAVDGLFALVLFSMVLCIFPKLHMESFSWIISGQWLVASLIMGIIPALALIALTGFQFSQQELQLFIIGVLMFCAGLAATLHHSPLISGLICGLVTANYCHYRQRALTTVIHAEKSIYVILLLLIGANWHIRFDYSLLLMILYFAIRLSGKLVGVYAATRIFRTQYPVPAHLGLGLISEGGLAIAIIVNFKLLYPLAIADTLITITVFSVLFSELLAPHCILRIFDKEYSLNETS